MIGDSLWNISRPGLALLALYVVWDGSSDDAASSSFAINFVKWSLVNSARRWNRIV
jgi:hypothetical protein